MNESKILRCTRRYALWTTLVSAVVLGVLLILLAWGVLDMFEQVSLLEQFEGGGSLFPSLTDWGRTIISVGLVASTASGILLALLVASHIKKVK